MSASGPFEADAVTRVELRRRVALAGGEDDLARQEELPRVQELLARERPLGEGAVVAAEREVRTPDTAALEVEPGFAGHSDPVAFRKIEIKSLDEKK